MSESNLASCPVCSYSLRGLPPVHRCPECGFAYDRWTRVWRPTNPWKGFGFLVVGFLMLAIFIAKPVRTLLAGSPPDAWDVLCAAVVLGSAIYIVLHLRSVNRRGRCAAVSPQGVFVRTHEAEKLIPWEDIAAVEHVERRVKEERDEFIAKIRTHSPHGAVEVDKIFSSDDERESFVRAVTANIQADVDREERPTQELPR